MNTACSSKVCAWTAGSLVLFAAAGCGAGEPPAAERLGLPRGWNTISSAPVFSPDGTSLAILAQQNTEGAIPPPDAFVWSRTDGKRRTVPLRNANDERLALTGHDVITTSSSSISGAQLIIRTARDNTTTVAGLPGSRSCCVTSLDVNPADEAIYVTKIDYTNNKGLILRVPPAGRPDVVGRTTGVRPIVKVGITAAERRIAILINSRGIYALVQPRSGKGSILQFTPKSHRGKYATTTGPVVRDIALTRDGRTLAVGIDGQPPQLWDLPRQRRRRAVGVPSGIGYVALSPSGRYLAVVDAKNAVKIWDGKTQAVAVSLEPRLPRAWIQGLAWSQRSELAIATQGGLRSTPMLVLWKLHRFS